MASTRARPSPSRLRRPLLVLASAAMLLPLAGCYDDYDGGPRGYGPPPPPPPPGAGYYRDAPPPPPPPPPPGGYYRDAPPPPPPPRDQRYDPARDYRGDDRPEQRMSRNDQVYQGHDGRYYCKRSDGTTGLIVGAVAGGIFGSLIGGHTLGTLLGAGGGALLGKSVDEGQVRCR